MSKSLRIWFLVIILAFATFLRFYRFTTTPPGLYPDEAIDGNNAAEALKTGDYKVFYTEDNGREGLYVNLMALALDIFKVHEPWVVRLPAAVAGVLTVWGIYLLAAELFGFEAGLLSAFLLATSFWHINFSRIGFRAILAPLLLIWSLYFLIKALRQEKNSKSSILYSVSAGIVYALGFYTYIAYRITPLLLLIFIPYFKKNPDFWKRVAVFVIAAFIVALPIGWYFLKHPADFFGRTAQVSVTAGQNPLKDFIVNAAKTALMFNFRGDYNWRHNLSGAPELAYPVGILFVVGVVWGIYSLSKKRGGADARLPFSLFLIFLWLVLAALPVALSNEGIPHALRSILMLPPAVMLAALGGLWVYGAAVKLGWQKIVKPLVWLFFVFLAVYAYIQYFTVWAPNPNVADAFNADYVQIGRAINALPQSAPKYVVMEAQGVMTRGLPMPAETVIFMTNSFLPDEQMQKNIHYLLPDQVNTIPPGSTVFYVN